MPHAAHTPHPARGGQTPPVTRPLREEMVYTKSGKIGFLQSETAHTVTIQLGPQQSLTLPKEEVDCRFRLV